jgi:RNA polymerase sigma factor (sigma-70 family)
MSGLSEIDAELRPLMLRALDGDATAYRRLLGQLDGHLRRYFGRRLQGASSSAAEDLAQETLMAIHTRRMTYDRAEPLTPWVFAIARYKLIDYFRRQRLRYTVPLEADDALFAADAEPDVTARIDVERMLGTLPAASGDLIRKTRLEDASVAEAAAAAGISETAAKVRIHRGLKALMARVAGGQRDER